MCDHTPDVKSKKTPNGYLLQLCCLQCQKYGAEFHYTNSSEAKSILESALSAWSIVERNKE